MLEGCKMIDYNYRRSVNPKRTPGRSSAKKKKESVSVIGVQTVLCMICILAAFLIKAGGGSIYAAGRQQVKQLFETSITLNDINSALKNVRSNFSDAVSVFNDLSKSASQAAGVPGNAGSSVSSVSSVSSNASSSKNSVGFSVASGQSAAKAEDFSVEGEGGADLSAPGNAAFTSAKLPPANATFAPVKLTVKPAVPVVGRLTSKFGYRIHPIARTLSFHTGIDIAASQGTPVSASLPGKIEKVGKSDSYGNYVIMDNGNGVETLYAHCYKILAPQGAVLRAGEVIAQVGSTGVSTGPHLHFEIRIHHIFVNPLWMLTVPA